MLELKAREIRNRHKGLFDEIEGFSDWIAKRKLHIKPGLPWRLEGHEYLGGILDAMNAGARVIGVRKAAQVGVSTLFLGESFYNADAHSAKSLYYFPSDVEVNDFSVDRADAMIRATSHLQSLTRGVLNVGLKHIGGGSLYFRGLWSKRKVKSIDGDALYLDELDEANAENIQYARDRLLHSSLRLERYFSQPSVPEFGIDSVFRQGTQEHWMLTCPACGKEQALELELDDGRYPKTFLQVPRKWKGGRFPARQKYYRGCVKCHAPLDMARGRMVARYPDREMRTFHLSQLYSQVKLSDGHIEDMLMADLAGARSSFQIARAVISIIGNPYVDANLQPVNDAVLRAATGDHGLRAAGEACYMGIDQGDTLTVVIGEGGFGRLKVIHLVETPDWRMLYDLMERFDVRHCLIDALPNKSDAKRFAAAFAGRVTIQYFKQTFARSTEPFVDGGQEVDVPRLMVDRNESLDDTAHALQEGELLLPRAGSAVVDDLHRHLKNLVKEKDENTGRVQYKKNTENHYGMALNSVRLAVNHAPSAPFIGVLPMGF
ncbi:MAG: phage terminase large subunit family protein [Candidatus Cloacimonetes bacterium]|nr:phage terminase large subunit family protein [Candidatus Cloacimonadota bacterium]